MSLVDSETHSKITYRTDRLVEIHYGYTYSWL